MALGLWAVWREVSWRRVLFLIEYNPTKIWQTTYLKGRECLQELIHSHCCESFSTHFKESLASWCLPPTSWERLLIKRKTSRWSFGNWNKMSTKQHHVECFPFSKGSLGFSHFEDSCKRVSFNVVVSMWLIHRFSDLGRYYHYMKTKANSILELILNEKKSKNGLTLPFNEAFP